MPWTPAHPAFTLPFFPFVKKPLLRVGLVVGAMVPDLPYFVLVRFVGWAHDFPVSFVFGIPMSIFLTLLWVKKIQAPFLLSLPIKIEFDQKPRAVKFLDIMTLGLAAGVGIFTHLFADSFTHEGRFAVRHLPVLKTVFFYDEPLWHLLQYGGTALGFLVIFVYLCSQLTWRRGWFTSQAKTFWLKAGVFSFLALLLILLFRYPFTHLTIMGVALIAAVAWGIVLASIFSPHRSVD